MRAVEAERNKKGSREMSNEVDLLFKSGTSPSQCSLCDYMSVMKFGRIEQIALNL